MGVQHVGAKPEKVSVFKIRKNPIERKRWIENIPREATPVMDTVVAQQYFYNRSTDIKKQAKPFSDIKKQ